MATRPTTRSTDRTVYEKARLRAKARSAAITLAGQDIAPLPAVADPRRRARADRDFRFFCESYFPDLFTLPFSQDHLRVIAKIERAVRHRDTFAVAMPRGSGKTTLCQIAVLWAILPGQHHFVMLIGGTQTRAEESLGNLKAHLAGSAGLLEDYPEAVYPIRMLDGETRRCTGQRYYGVPTRIEWKDDQIVLPSIPGSRCGGAIIRVAGLTGYIRGALYVMPDGRQVRPSLAICDDPQTDESARSLLQTAARESIINGAVFGLAGPAERTAVVIPCTVIQHGDLADRLLDRKTNPTWRGERTKMVYEFPTSTKLWGEYARLYAESLQADGDGAEATALYAEHRGRCGASLAECRPCGSCSHKGGCMDAGAVVAWPERYEPDVEISAIQHAMNLKLRDEAAFFAEYQNEPLVLEDAPPLSAEEIAGKVNGRSAGEVPLGCTHLTAFVDVHDNLLYWCVCAWEADFTGFVLDYGTFPKQGRRYFTLRDAKPTMQSKAPRGAGKEAAILAGLGVVIEQLAGGAWKRDDGALMKVGRCLVDAGYVPDLVFQAIRASPHAGVVMPSRGIGIGARNKPFSEYQRKRGEQYGHHWRIPSVHGRRELRTLNIDTNYWKTFVQRRLLVPLGDRGCLSLYGQPDRRHQLLAEHLTAEHAVRTEGYGRQVDEWRIRPGVTENHWLDGIVGCAVAASMLGVALFTQSPATKKKRRPRAAVTYL